jgi:hypothetical protein
MNRAGIPEVFREVRQHSFEDCAVHGCRRIVIKIDMHSCGVKHSE